MAVSIRDSVVEVDVAIIGAGPAGSTLAALLAKRGHAVLLIDRDTFPRDKVCGEFLSYDALPVLERMGVDLRGASAIDRCRIVSRRRTYEFPFPNEARGISRMLFDDLLYRTALANGAVALEGEPAIGDHRALTCNGVEIRSKVIAGAWGRWGRFDQQLSRAFIRDRTHRSFGFKRHYRGRHEPGVIELYSFARGYLGVNDVEDGITNICGLVHGDRLRQHRGKWESFVEEIRREEQPLDALYGRFAPAQQSFLSSDPVIFRARSAVEQGVFMVGDASGVIDPLTGNGMAMAIQSALLAAPHIEKALHDRGAAEDAYRRAHAAMFAPRIAWSRSVARLLSHPAALDQALRFARTPAIGGFLLRRTRAAREQIERMADRWFV